MNKAIKTLLSSIISLVVVISCLSFPVSADTTKNIELDQYLHSETECTPFTEYKVIIPQTTYYHFRLITTGLEYDSVEVDMIPEMDKTSPYFHIFDSKGTEYLTYHEVWWKSGAAYADSTHYLEKGEYTFYISSKDYCNLFIDGFDGEIYITEDGKRISMLLCTNMHGSNSLEIRAGSALA